MFTKILNTLYFNLFSLRRRRVTAASADGDIYICFEQKNWSEGASQ